MCIRRRKRRPRNSPTSGYAVCVAPLDGLYPCSVRTVAIVRHSLYCESRRYHCLDAVPTRSECVPSAAPIQSTRNDASLRGRKMIPRPRPRNSERIRLILPHIIVVRSQAYLHKSSVAGCFAGLLDMTSEGDDLFALRKAPHGRVK